MVLVVVIVAGWGVSACCILPNPVAEYCLPAPHLMALLKSVPLPK